MLFYPLKKSVKDFLLWISIVEINAKCLLYLGIIKRNLVFAGKSKCVDLFTIAAYTLFKRHAAAYIQKMHNASAQDLAIRRSKCRRYSFVSIPLLKAHLKSFA